MAGDHLADHGGGEGGEDGAEVGPGEGEVGRVDAGGADEVVPEDLDQRDAGDAGVEELDEDLEGAAEPFDGLVGDAVEELQAGLDELFLELNFDPTVASPDSDPKASMATALRLLEELSPSDS